MLRRLLVKISRYVGAAGKADSAGAVLLTVRRAVLCLLRNYASVCLLWQLLDLLSYAPPEKRYALTAGAVTFLAVMIFLVAGLDQLAPGQGTHDTISCQPVGLLECQHCCVSLASKDAVHAAAGIPLGVEQLLELTHGITAGAGAEHGLGRDGRHVHGRGVIELRPSELAHDTVHAKAISLLEGSHRRIGLGSEDAVHVAGIEALGIQLLLQRLDSVAGAAPIHHGHIGYHGGVVAAAAGGGGLAPQLDGAVDGLIVGAVGGGKDPLVELVGLHSGGVGQSRTCIIHPLDRAGYGEGAAGGGQRRVTQLLAAGGDLGVGRLAGGGCLLDGEGVGLVGCGAVRPSGGGLILQRHGDGVVTGVGLGIAGHGVVRGIGNAVGLGVSVIGEHRGVGGGDGHLLGNNGQGGRGDAEVDAILVGGGHGVGADALDIDGGRLIDVDVGAVSDVVVGTLDQRLGAVHHHGSRLLGRAGIHIGAGDGLEHVADALGLNFEVGVTRVDVGGRFAEDIHHILARVGGGRGAAVSRHGGHRAAA